MLYGETMKEICAKLGVDRKELPDGLYSTLLGAIKDRVASVTDKAVSGDILRMDDVSPVEQSVNVKVKSKNLFDGALISGIVESLETITNDKTGAYKSIKVYLKAGNYTLSFGKDITLVRIVIDGNYQTTFLDYIKQYSFTAVSDGYVYFSFRDAESGVVWDDATTIQLEEGETATEYTPYVDVSTVKVARCGKNLYDNGTIVDKRVIPTSGYPKYKIPLPNGTYSWKLQENKFFDSGYYALWTDETAFTGEAPKEGYAYSWIGNTKDESICKNDGQFTVTRGYIYLAVTGGEFSGVVECKELFDTMQIEHGETATEYEAYKGATYTPNADGTVDGVASVSPAMTIFADKDGVTLDVEYTRDFEAVKSAVE